MYSRQTSSSSKLLFRICFSLVLLFMMVLSFSVFAHPAHAASTHVDAVVINSDIGPVSLRLLTRAIDTAQRDGAQALIVEIDTPGGDLESMKSMTQVELASNVPVVAYVSPTGGRAASAGAFVTLAAQVAAMAPVTRIGASSPVTSTGSDIESTLDTKIKNDLEASITSIQNKYGRNVPLATRMVSDAASYDDQTAIREKIVDLGAPNLNSLLNAINGRTVNLDSGQTVTLNTAGASVQMIDATVLDTFYGLILDPTVVFLLFIVAMIGIYLEISHPGAILPGVAGAIALILFLFAAGSLSPNWAGLALMVLAFVLLVLDVQLPTHGVLTIGAVISLVMGALIFFNSGGPYGGPQINPLIVYSVGGIVGLIGLSLVAFIVRAQRTHVTTGVEGMIGSRVVALTPLLPDGRVSYGGEDWSAILEPTSASADAGSELQVVGVEGLRLHVKPMHSQPIIDTSSVSTRD